jgi:hypothetical protein
MCLAVAYLRKEWMSESPGQLQARRTQSTSTLHLSYTLRRSQQTSINKEEVDLLTHQNLYYFVIVSIVK